MTQLGAGADRRHAETVVSLTRDVERVRQEGADRQLAAALDRLIMNDRPAAASPPLAPQPTVDVSRMSATEKIAFGLRQSAAGSSAGPQQPANVSALVVRPADHSKLSGMELIKLGLAQSRPGGPR